MGDWATPAAPGGAHQLHVGAGVTQMGEIRLPPSPQNLQADCHQDPHVLGGTCRTCLQGALLPQKDAVWELEQELLVG